MNFSVSPKPQDPLLLPSLHSLTPHWENQADLEDREGALAVCLVKTQRLDLIKVMGVHLRNFMGKMMSRWGHIFRKPSAC